MATSISRRIFKTFFINGLISLAVVIAFIWLVFDDMEDALISRDAQEQLSLLRLHSQVTGHNLLQFPLMTAYFDSDHDADPELPAIFRNLPVPYIDERDWQGKSYHIFISRQDNGTFYLAKDVSDFEHREMLFTSMLGLLCIIVILLNFLLSTYANRRLINPLKQLTYQIHRAAAADQHLQALDYHYSDTELIEIAEAFNRFNDEIRALIKRERTLISLASHELRTPTAIISGAVQVIEQRGQLSPSDQVTFNRIRNAVDEMEDNIETLLTLSRRARSNIQKISVPLEDFLNVLVDEFGFLNPEDRIRIKRVWQVQNRHIETDPVLAKLLIRNLLRNALNHTKGQIMLVLSDGFLDVLDQGEGLPRDVANWIDRPDGELPVQEGLGLYIVTLAVEQLGWSIGHARHAEFGQGVRVYFAANPDTPSR